MLRGKGRSWRPFPEEVRTVVTENSRTLNSPLHRACTLLTLPPPFSDLPVGEEEEATDVTQIVQVQGYLAHKKQPPHRTLQ